MITTAPNGWAQQAADGRWRALSTSGVLTHHNSLEEALHELSCRPDA